MHVLDCYRLWVYVVIFLYAKLLLWGPVSQVAVEMLDIEYLFGFSQAIQ